MARKSPQDAAAKWVQRVQQSGDYYRQGVATTNKDWAANSVAASARRDQALIQAINSGRINAGITRAGTNKWRQNTLNKGVNNWVQNTPRAQQAYLSGLQRSYNYMNAADQAIADMPSVTAQDRISRAAAWLTAMHDQSQADKNANG